MNALLLALALAGGPELYDEPALPHIFADGAPVFEDTFLPRSLSEVPAPPAAAKADLEFYIGGHFAITYVYGTADLVGVNIGGVFRMHILPWLGAEGSIDVNWIEQGIVGVPIRFSALFYPPTWLFLLLPRAQAWPPRRW